MSEIENRSSSSSNKRGPYLQYLAGRDVKIPKVSKWRRQLNVPTTHECDGLSLPEVNFEEENSSLLNETNKDNKLDSICVRGTCLLTIPRSFWWKVSNTTLMSSLP